MLAASTSHNDAQVQQPIAFWGRGRPGSPGAPRERAASLAWQDLRGAGPIDDEAQIFAELYIARDANTSRPT